MRGIFQVIILLLLIANLSQAQIPDKIGLKVGYGSSSLRFDRLSTAQDGLVAPVISLIAEWDVKSWLYISAEPGLVHRGYSDYTFFKPFGPIPTSSSEVRLRYFSLPVLAKIKPFQWGVAPYIEVGPRVDVLLFREINNAGSYVRQVFNEYNTVTGGASAGLGVQMGHLLPSIDISLGARYNWDAFDSYSDVYYDIKNRSAELWLGISYSF